MYTFLFLFVTTLSFGQSLNYLDGGVEDIISKKLEAKSIKYKELYFKGNNSYYIDNKFKIILSNTFSAIELNRKGKKILFSQMTKDKKNIFLNLDNVFCLNYNKEIYYILEFTTLNQGVSNNTFNLIVTKDKILFKQWNSSGDGISNAFGVLNHKLFLLNQIRDSINYYELRNERMIYKSNFSTKIKIDSLWQVYVPVNYKF